MVVVVEDDVDALGEPREAHDGEELHEQHHFLARLLRIYHSAVLSTLIVAGWSKMEALGCVILRNDRAGAKIY